MKELLLNYDSNVLKEIARAHGVDTKTLAKPEVAERLAARLTQRAEIERSLAAAPVAERAILARARRRRHRLVGRAQAHPAERGRRQSHAEEQGILLAGVRGQSAITPARRRWRMPSRA